MNPGPFTCKANALPLSYIPVVSNHRLPTQIVNSVRATLCYFNGWLKRSNLRIFKSFLALEIPFLANIKYKNGFWFDTFEFGKKQKRFQSPFVTIDPFFGQPRLTTVNQTTDIKAKQKNVPSVWWF